MSVPDAVAKTFGYQVNAHADKSCRFSCEGTQQPGQVQDSLKADNGSKLPVKKRPSFLRHQFKRAEVEGTALLQLRQAGR